MKTLTEKLTGPLVFAVSLGLFAGLVLDLERRVLEPMEGTELSFHPVASSPLMGDADVQKLQLDSDSPDLKSLQDSALSLPWVRDVAFRRVWPDQLKLYIVPRQPLAIWDDERILSRDGRLVAVSDMKARFAHLGLPRVEAQEQRIDEVVEKLVWLQANLRPLQLGVSRLKLEAWGGLSIQTDREQSIQFGSQDLENRLSELKRMVRAGMLEAGRIATIDLRYRGRVAISRDPEALR